MVVARNFGSSICFTALLMKIIIESFAVKKEQNREIFGEKNIFFVHTIGLYICNIVPFFFLR